MRHPGKIVRLVLILLMMTLAGTGSTLVVAQHVPANQKKIDKAREKKAKQNLEKYQKAVKKHFDNQSKETKKMMKKAKKDAKKRMPGK
jgi:hypothetical protein